MKAQPQRQSLFRTLSSCRDRSSAGRRAGVLLTSRSGRTNPETDVPGITLPEATAPQKLPLWMVHGLMLTASILVSSSFIVGKKVTYDLDPAVLTLIRFLLAVLLFAPYIKWRYGLALPEWRALARYGAISACIVIFFWCMFLALRSTSPLNTSALFTLVPGISSLIGTVLLRERLGRYRLLALVCGLTGALWVIFRGELGRFLALDLNSGDLIFLAGCLAMGFYTPLVMFFHRQEPMAVMTFWVLTTGLAWLFIPAAPGLATTDWSRVGPEVWAGIIYLAIFTTIITFYLTQISIPYLGSSRVMAYSYFYPALVLVLDWLLGRGLPPVWTLPGVLMVVAAMFVLQNGARPCQGPPGGS